MDFAGLFGRHLRDEPVTVKELFASPSNSDSKKFEERGMHVVFLSDREGRNGSKLWC